MREIIRIIFSVVLLLVSLTFIVLASVALGVDAYNIMSLSYSELLGLLITFSVLFLASMFLVGIFSYKLNINRKLIFAACNGKREVVQRLLEKGADVNQANKGGATPLMLASRNGGLEVVSLLLDSGANVEQQKEYSGDTALILAAREGHLEVVQLLLGRGANVNQANKSGAKPLLVASEKGHTEVVELLLDPKEINAKNMFGDTALILASRGGHMGVVKLLLDRDADTNIKNYLGWTAISVASVASHTEIVDLLFDESGPKSADRNAWEVVANNTFPGGDMFGALEDCIEKGQIKLAKMVIEKIIKKTGGSVLTDCNEKLKAALVLARENGAGEIEKILLANSVNVEAIDIASCEECKGGDTAHVSSYVPVRAASMPFVAINNVSFPNISAMPGVQEVLANDIVDANEFKEID